MSRQSFRGPVAEVGEVVLLHPDRDEASKPVVGFVTGIGDDGSLKLTVVNHHTKEFEDRTGVFHADDPRGDVAARGCWREGPDAQRRRELEASLNAGEEWKHGSSDEADD